MIYNDHMEKRIIGLEKKVSFQDQMIEELNGALAHQQKRIDALEKQLKNFHEQLTSEDLVRKPQDEDPPPHY